MVMKGVGIADLKARLSEHLKAVRKGGTITVLDRNTPVAQIVPFITEPIEVRRATRRTAFGSATRRRAARSLADRSPQRVRSRALHLISTRAAGRGSAETASVARAGGSTGKNSMYTRFIAA